MSYVKTDKSLKFGESSVLEEQLLYQGRWSNLVEFSYEDEKNKYVNGKDCTGKITLRQLLLSPRWNLLNGT
ncbi:MAG: hypothetical protein MK434_10310 [SAR324 cluster bacterium]|nr:hypothetical protein [SAR324 cluster bacterium]